MAGKERPLPDTPRYSPYSAYQSPDSGFVARLKMYTRDIVELNRRSPQGIPGALLDFYTEKIEDCGVILIALNDFETQVFNSQLCYTDRQPLLLHATELREEVCAITRNAQTARKTCQANLVTEVQRIVVDQ